MKVLLNCALGEGEKDGTRAEMLGLVDLVHVACSGPAGDEATMRHVLVKATARGLQVGAYVGWPDRGGSGQDPQAGPDDLARLLQEPIGQFLRVASAEGARLAHVKLRGALDRLCEERTDWAEACVDWMESELEGAALIVGAGGLLHAVAEARGVPLLREVRAGRVYEDEARLVPPGQPGAVIEDPAEAARCIAEWRRTGYHALAGGRRWLVEAETVGVSADSPWSMEIARAVREVLGTVEGAAGQ